MDSKILVNQFTRMRSSTDYRADLALQEVLRGMENNGHEIISVSVTLVYDGVHMFVVSRLRDGTGQIHEAQPNG